MVDNPSNLHDATRLAALGHLTLLDSPAEAAFDRLTRLASKIVDAPVSLVSLVAADRQFFKSAFGLAEPWASQRGTPLAYSFCQYVVTTGEPLIVEDAREHPVLSNNLAIPELNVIAYLGIPLVTPDGAELGAFCVIDHKPRVWTEREIEIVRELAAATMTEIELREEKQRAESALRENEARLQRLTENAQDIIYRYRLKPTAGLEYINPAITTMTGYTVAECYAEPGLFFSLIHPDDEGLLAQLLIPEQTLSQHVVLRWVHKDGSTLWTEQSNVLLKDEEGQFVAMEGIIRDITRRKQAEEAVRESEQRFRSLFEQSPVAIAIIRGDTLLFANHRFTHLFGYEESIQVVGTSYLDLVALQHRDEFLDNLRQAEQRRTLPLALEIVCQSKTGAEFPVYVEVGSLHLPEGRATVAFVSDLTERKRLEEGARKAEIMRVEMEKEKEFLDLKERFVATVSHDFRTPLTVITLANGLLEMRYDSFTAEQRLRQIHQIQVQVKYMTELLDDVLAFSRARADKVTFYPAPMDLYVLCTSIVEQFQLINQNGHTIVFDSQGELTNLLMDESLLRHILVNLLSNAIKYSPEGGQVRLWVEKHIGSVIFRINDQGIGIPLADQERLFEPFHRAKNALKISGTGLGLSIVKSNVEAHGGTIVVESQEKIGTTFIVRLPISP